MSTVPDFWRSRHAFDDPGARADAALRPLEPAERYERLALIGEGGMGRVWLGWDTLIERNVAIKEALGAPDSPAAARLEREVTLTASLDHPGVPAIFDVFVLEGRPHVVMEMIQGHTLRALVEGSRAQVRHVLAVCEVVAHAHRRRVLHRDLSPANVLIEESGAARLIDFGLALSLEDAADAPPASGTPGYMAPEQAAGGALDPRADVWALGALLHLVLHGRPPGEHPARSDGPLDAICARAIAADPGQRYRDAGHMSEDLLAWFEGRRVEALEASPWRVARWFVARHRARLTAAAAALAALLCSLAWGVVRTRDEANRARDAEASAVAERQRAVAASAEARRDADAANAATARLRLRAARAALDSGDILEARAQLERASALADDPEAVGLRMHLDLVPEPRRLGVTPAPECAGALVLTDTPDLILCRAGATTLQGWRDLDLAWSLDLAAAPTLVDDRIRDIRVGPTHARILFAHEGAFDVDLQTGHAVRVHDRPAIFASPRHALLLSRDARRLVPSRADSPCSAPIVQVHEDHGERVTLCVDGEAWLERGGRAERIYDGLLGVPNQYAYLPGHDERWLSTSDGSLWPIGQPNRRVQMDAPPRSVTPIPGTRALLVRQWDGVWQVLDTAQGQWLASLDPSTRAARPSRSGSIQALTDAGLELWELPSPELTTLYRADFGFTDLAWSHDGAALAATSGGALLHHFTPRDGARARPVASGDNVMKSVTALPDSGFVAVNIFNPAGAPLRRFDVREGALEHAPLAPDSWATNELRRVEWMREGALLLLHTSGNVVRVDLSAGAREPSTQPLGAYVTDLSADASHRLAIALSNERVHVRSPEGEWSAFPAPARAHRVAIAADGRFAVGARDALHLHGPDGVKLHSIPVAEPISSVTWRPEHDLVVTGHTNGSVHTWDTRSGQLLATLRHHDGVVASLAFSPDARLLATASWDTTVALVSFTPMDTNK